MDPGKKRGFRDIAIRASGSGGPHDPLQIRAQVLRGKQVSAHAGMLGFALPEDPPPDGGAAEPRWREADIDRAIDAAERAGLRAYRIEIAPDGTIAIVVGTHDTD